MTKIQILPESLIRLIAAGEVIERPASVVKELVENSLDAGATSVSVDLWSAGRARIRVSDNGEGMTPDDARAALERHATSKLREFHDLESMATFGFRGEALPSIAAVSRFELSTRVAAADQGWSLKLEAGKLVSAQATGIPTGTTIDVQDLFFNTPARAKFLKHDSTERSRTLKTLQEMALAHPNVRFEVTMDDRPILSLAPAKDLRGRLADLWTPAIAGKLREIRVTQGPCSISGFVNAVEAHHPTRAFQALFVNQRPVQQRMLAHAVGEAYREWLPVGRHPIYCLFVDLDPVYVDVNVHPAKREVRISNERAVYELLYKTIREHIQGANTLSPRGWERATAGRVRGEDPSTVEFKTALLAQTPLTFESVATAPLIPTFSHPAGGEGKSTIDVNTLRYLGQFQKLYLLFEQGDELLLVDQHAASERVLYERLLAQVSAHHVARQTLLAPLLWDVPADQAETIRTMLPEFETMGFALDAFGPSSFALKEWPVVLPETKHAKRFLEEVLESFQNERPVSGTDVQRRIAASAACRAAVMANDSLSIEEVTRLVEDLSTCERPMTCPHGRPTQIRFPITDLHRRFQRT